MGMGFGAESGRALGAPRPRLAKGMTSATVPATSISKPSAIATYRFMLFVLKKSLAIYFATRAQRWCVLYPPCVLYFCTTYSMPSDPLSLYPTGNSLAGRRGGVVHFSSSARRRWISSRIALEVFGDVLDPEFAVRDIGLDALFADVLDPEFVEFVFGNARDGDAEFVFGDGDAAATGFVGVSKPAICGVLNARCK